MQPFISAGLFYIENFMTADEEQALIRSFASLTWQEVALFGKIARRRVVHFGMDYNYINRSINPQHRFGSILEGKKSWYLKWFLMLSSIQHGINRL